MSGRTEPPPTAKDHRGRIAASILVVLLVGAYFVAAPGAGGALPLTFVVNAVILAAAFWFPSRWIGRPADVLASPGSLALWALAWTLAWDLATAGVGARAPLQEWWLVYPSGLIFLLGLLLLHGAIVWRFADRAGPPPRDPVR